MKVKNPNDFMDFSVPLCNENEQAFLPEVKKHLQNQLALMTGTEKRKFLKDILTKLPKKISQKLFATKGPFVSLVVCVYNMEKYLAECLESLIHQTLQNIEIICVNDGSMDHSLKILQDYAAHDKRIKIVSQKNQGPSIARRVGMSHVTGEYTQYVDADDYLEADACECLYLYSKIYDLDMCSFMAIEFFDETRKEYETPYHRLQWLDAYPKPVMTVEDIQPIVHKVAVSTALTIYKNKFLKNCRIEWENKPLLFEDTLFFTEAIFKAKRFGSLKETFYHRRVHEASVTHNLDAHFSEWCQVVLGVFAMVKPYGNKEILNNYLELYVPQWWNIYNNFSVPLQNRYKQDVLNFYEQLILEYQYPVTQEMQHWYNTISK